MDDGDLHFARFDESLVNEIGALRVADLFRGRIFPSLKLRVIGVGFRRVRVLREHRGKTAAKGQKDKAKKLGSFSR